MRCPTILAMAEEYLLRTYIIHMVMMSFPLTVNHFDPNMANGVKVYEHLPLAGLGMGLLPLELKAPVFNLRVQQQF